VAYRKKDDVFCRTNGHNQLTISPDGRGFVNVHGSSTKLSQYYDYMTPMQFTGLCDKNGKEICEGDIIISRDVNDVVNDSMGHLCSVIFHDGAFCISTGMKQSLCYGYAVRFEVIGNIHENPQLLD